MRIQHQAAARMVAAVLFLGLLASSSAYAQTNPTNCSWPGRAIPVFFDPTNISANGFDVSAWRSTMLNAMAVWNEESRGDIDFYYAGETSLPQIYGAVVVNATNTIGTCTSDPDTEAATSWGSESDCSINGSQITVGLRSPCTNVVRPWTTNWPAAGQWDLESTLIHELGHTMSHGDTTTVHDSVMWYTRTTTAGGAHLYPIDQNTVIYREGVAARLAGTAQSATGVSWV